MPTYVTFDNAVTTLGHTPKTKIAAAKHHQAVTKHVGGKGANLIRMVSDMKLPVPPAFIIPTTYSRAMVRMGHDPKLVIPNHGGALKANVQLLEQATGRKFGDIEKMPLLLSVRSGAAVSMPGMMDTVLNVGLNEQTVEALAAATNEDFAWDSYRRFITMYADTVNGVDVTSLNADLAAAREFVSVPSGTIPADITKELVAVAKKKLGKNVPPQDVYKQLQGCVVAVWESWSGDRAVAYRDMEGLSHTMGTAVTVQSMVFGNLNERSGTGVVFTRNPNTGENERFGDFLVNAQGEDVVDGSSVTQPISTLEMIFPEAAAELDAAIKKIEKATGGDLNDIEFTIEDGKLWMLQTRIGKRTAHAQVQITIDRLAAKAIKADEAHAILIGLLNDAKKSASGTVHDGSDLTPAGSGLSAVPGEAVGFAVFSSDEAVKRAEAGETVILVRNETSPADVAGMRVAAGILTATGGLVSHAAVVARGWNIPCIVGCTDLSVSEKNNTATIHGNKITEGDLIKIDGTTGQVFT